MNVRHLVYVIGLVLLGLTGGLLLSAAIAAGYGEGDVGAFLLSAAISGGAGTLAVSTARLERDLSIREGYAVVSLTWIAVGIVGALPYLFSGTIASPAAALFESVSGFTTTGATVFGDIEALPHGILFWRALTQWLGGMGILVLAIAILPILGVGGMQLFRAEVPGLTTERLKPRIAQTAKSLWLVYLGFTVAQALLLLAGGLGAFDAVTHALTTMPTGGFSTRNASVAAYDSAFVQYVFILFMYLAGVNFALHFRALRGAPRVYAASTEWKFFTAILALAMLSVFLINGAGGDAIGGIERQVRDALFQTVSIATTTGYVNFDYDLWPIGSQLVLLLLMFMGGMAGSTAGGMKAVRVYLVARLGGVEMKKALHPRAVVLPRLGRTSVPEDILLKALGFVLLFLSLFAGGVVILTVLGHDLTTAIGASAASIGNIGPGLGQVGAIHNYGWMDIASQVVLAFLMIVGRLEIFTVLLLFHPDLWRHRGRAPRLIPRART